MFKVFVKKYLIWPMWITPLVDMFVFLSCKKNYLVVLDTAMVNSYSIVLLLLLSRKCDV